MLESISDISAALQRGEISAVELLDRSLERIATRDPELNSFVALDRSGARNAAEESDRLLQAGKARSPLEGVPISIKDNILAKGMAATWGSKGLADFLPDRDELPVERLRHAGAVILGKTNVPEFTLEGYTNNDLFGLTRNPWNVELTPGGSSGGAAAGVAAGLVPAALGTDGGGSIRRPACHTGLVGWKPSTGHIPRLFGFPSILTDFEVIGTLTRTVADACILDAVMKGSDRRDRRSIFQRPESWSDRPRKILYIKQIENSPVDPEVTAATDRFACDLARGGAEVIELTGPLPFNFEAANRIWRVVSRAGVAYLMHWHSLDLETCAGSSVLAMVEDGRTVTGEEYIGALEAVTALRLDLEQLFDDYDLVLTPSAASLPWPAADPYPQRIDEQPAGPRDHAVFTGWVNIGGIPAINLPVAQSKDRLPIGVQLVAGFGRDEELLDFAQGIFPGDPGLVYDGK